MAARMIRLGWIQKLDPAKIPNVQANLLPSLLNRPFDTENRISIPWQSGLAGLAYNGNVTKELRTVDELLTRPDLKGKVTALSEMRDTMGLLLGRTGTTRPTSPPPSSTTRSTSSRRPSTPGRSASSPATTTRPTWPRATSPRASAGPATSSSSSGEDEKVRFVAPDSGVMLFSDNMMVPNKATHKAQRRSADQLLLRAGGRRRSSPRTSTTSARSRARRPRWRRSTPSWPPTR